MSRHHCFVPDRLDLKAPVLEIPPSSSEGNQSQRSFYEVGIGTFQEKLGELLVSLSYLPACNRLNMTVVKVGGVRIKWVKNYIPRPGT